MVGGGTVGMMGGVSKSVNVELQRTTLHDHLGLGAEVRWLPEAEVGILAGLNGSDHVRHAVGDSRVDGVLREEGGRRV